MVAVAVVGILAGDGHGARRGDLGGRSHRTDQAFLSYPAQHVPRPCGIPSFASQRRARTTCSTYDRSGSNGTTAFTDFNDISFTGVTLTARGALIYNTSEAAKSVCVLDFGGDKTATAGTFTIQFPNANDTQAIIRIS